MTNVFQNRRLLTNIRDSGKIDPKTYNEYLYINNGNPTMYMKLKKALYGTLQAAMLFWKDLTKTLMDWGFIVNPYDRCVPNKMIDRKQCTVLWHVDHIKISHVSKDVVTNVIEYLSGISCHLVHTTSLHLSIIII